MIAQSAAFSVQVEDDRQLLTYETKYLIVSWRFVFVCPLAFEVLLREDFAFVEEDCLV